MARHGLAVSYIGKMGDSSQDLGETVMSENMRLTSKLLKERAEEAYKDGKFIRCYTDTGRVIGDTGKSAP